MTRVHSTEELEAATSTSAGYICCPGTSRCILIPIPLGLIGIAIVLLLIGFWLFSVVADSNSLEACPEPPCEENRRQGIGFLISGGAFLIGSLVALILIFQVKPANNARLRQDSSPPPVPTSTLVPAPSGIIKPCVPPPSTLPSWTPTDPSHVPPSLPPPPSHGMASPSIDAAASAPSATPFAASFCERAKYCGAWGEYDGEFDGRGKRHGRGMFAWDCGHMYVGDWRNGERHGHGTFTAANGNVYDGEYKDGRKEGHGRETFEGGDVYDGDFRDGKREGQGQFTNANGDVYCGEYKDGKKEGHGRYTFANGDVCHGDWQGGKFEGRGAYAWANGRVDVSRYRAGNSAGEGARWSKDRRTAWRLQDGEVQEEIGLDAADTITRPLYLPVIQGCICWVDP